MRRIISALLLCFSSAWAAAQGAAPIELAPDAPDRHIVVPGDTLWGIASKFLKDPYRWPDVWRLNPDDIKNPHRIYPGQVVILDKSGEQPLLKLGRMIKAEPRIYVEDQQKEIPAIPQNVIEPFLSNPLVVDGGDLEKAARVIASQENHVYLAPGDRVYATKIQPGIRNWQVFRLGKAMADPDRPDPEQPGEVLGVEAIYLGSAKLVKEGEPATLEVTSVRQEIGRNDYLLPTPAPEIMSYVPHAPAQKINGRVIALYGGVGEGGRFSIVSFSRGKRDGLEVGHVLDLYRAGKAVQNRYNDQKETYVLPDERYGNVFVFRVFERVSYALVMTASRSVVAGDYLRTP